MTRGQRVKLSQEGIARRIAGGNKSGIHPKDVRGVVVGTPYTAGCTRVRWDHASNPETIALSFVEVDTEGEAEFLFVKSCDAEELTLP